MKKGLIIGLSAGAIAIAGIAIGVPVGLVVTNNQTKTKQVSKIDKNDNYYKMLVLMQNSLGKNIAATEIEKHQTFIDESDFDWKSIVTLFDVNGKVMNDAIKEIKSVTYDYSISGNSQGSITLKIIFKDGITMDGKSEFDFICKNVMWAGADNLIWTNHIETENILNGYIGTLEQINDQTVYNQMLKHKDYLKTQVRKNHQDAADYLDIDFAIYYRSSGTHLEIQIKPIFFLENFEIGVAVSNSEPVGATSFIYVISNK